MKRATLLGSNPKHLQLCRIIREGHVTILNYLKSGLRPVNTENKLIILKMPPVPEHLYLALDLQQRSTNIFSAFLFRGAIWCLGSKRQRWWCGSGWVLLFLCRETPKGICHTYESTLFEGLIWKQIGLHFVQRHFKCAGVTAQINNNVWTFTEPFIKWYQNNSAYKALGSWWTKYSLDT